VDATPDSPVESISAALVYLMTQYARTGCPRLALYVSRHLPAPGGQAAGEFGAARLPGISATEAGELESSA